MSGIPFGYVRFQSGIVNVTALITPGVAKLTGGHAKFAIQPRERRVSLVEYDGRDPITMEIPILLDGIRSGDDVEMQVTLLSRLVRRPGDVEPGIVTATGTLPSYGIDWRMSIAWGDDVIYDRATSNRLRQDAVVTLTEASEATLLSPAIVGAYRGPWVTHKMGRGETLATLAAKYSNSSARRAWYLQQVRAKNGLKATWRPKVGFALKVPRQ
jgi:hypothetical protein